MKKLSLLGLLFLAFFACREDIDESTPVTTTEEPPIIINEYNPESDLVTGTIFGLVYDENENPVQDATVSYAGKTYTTDEAGRFIIKDETLDRQGTFFTVEANGFFKGSRRLYPRDGSVNYAYIQLLALNEIGSFGASDGGELEGADGLEISFSPNSIRSESGALYNGQVSVAAKWLDPTADNIGEIMPGDLLGLNARVEEVALVSYGMMAVELFGDNGEKLNIAEGNTATLSFPVPQELLDSAPGTIPLWSFEDEQYGIWAEEGSATLQNGMYVGEVSHFSFWNCDVPYPLVYIEGRLTTSTGLPLVNTAIAIHAAEINGLRYGTTDNRGFFAGKMPADKELSLLVIRPGENCLANATTLGSFSTDTNVGQVLAAEIEEGFSVRGSVVDCDNNAITNGLVKIQSESFKKEYYVNDGSFELVFSNCHNNVNEIIITALDLDNNEQGLPKSYPVEPIVDVGVLAACGNEIKEQCTLNLNGQISTVFTGLGANFDGDNMFMAAGWINGASFGIGFSITSPLVGTYELSDVTFLNLEVTEPTFNANERIEDCQDECTNLSFFDIIITENGGVGGHWAGEFSGEGIFTNQIDTTTSTIPFSGEFRVPIN